MSAPEGVQRSRVMRAFVLCAPAPDVGAARVMTDRRM